MVRIFQQTMGSLWQCVSKSILFKMYSEKVIDAIIRSPGARDSHPQHSVANVLPLIVNNIRI